MVVYTHLVRNYYEKHGGFAGIESSPYYNEMVEIIGKVEIRRFLYEAIGFYKDSKLNGEERYKLRKRHALSYKNPSDIKVMKRDFDVVFDSDLADRLNSLDCFAVNASNIDSVHNIINVSKDLFKDDNILKVVKLYAACIEASGMLNLNLISSGQSIESLKGLLEGPEIDKTIKSMGLTMKKVTSSIEPFVEGKTIYMTKALNNVNLTQARNDIKKMAIYEACFGVISVPYKKRNTLKQLLATNSCCQLSSAKYRELVDISIQTGLTIENLARVMRLSWNDMSNHLSRYGGLVVPQYNDYIGYIPRKATVSCFEIKLTQEEFKNFYESDYLSTISVDSGKFTVNIGGTIDLDKVVIGLEGR